MNQPSKLLEKELYESVSITLERFPSVSPLQAYNSIQAVSVQVLDNLRVKEHYKNWKKTTLL